MANDALQYVKMSTLSIQDDKIPQPILLYPNPAINLLNIKTNKNIEEIKIYSIAGKLIKSVRNKNQIQFQIYIF
ncbi:MAG: T9SS type A sorting domain-containing protein [Polaribacter sp.]|nr:T9SS type A sorting domain-containing protein [Polaribacter sp.]